jgi:hypothetical protein
MKSPHGLLLVRGLALVPGLVLVLGLAGCAAGPSYRTPKPDLPPQFASSTGAPAVGGERRSCGVVEGAR